MTYSQVKFKMGFPTSDVKIILTKYYEEKLDTLFKPIFERAVDEYLFCVTQSYIKSDLLRNVPEYHHDRFLSNVSRSSEFIKEFEFVNREIKSITMRAQSFLQNDYYKKYINGEMTTLDMIVVHPRFAIPTVPAWMESDWTPHIVRIRDLVVLVSMFSGDDVTLKTSVSQILRNLQKFDFCNLLE